MSSGDRSLIGELETAGWTMTRQGRGSHTFWKCPCGLHTATVPMGRKSHDVAPRDGNPILKRIRQCMDLRALASASVTPAHEEEDMGKSTRPGAHWNPGVTLKGTRAKAEQEFPVQVRREEPAPQEEQPRRTVGAIEVIAAEPALAPHPHSQEPIPVKGAHKLLLADGSEVFSCDDCDYIGRTGSAVRTHRSVHTPGWRERKSAAHTGKRRPGRDDTIAALVRAVKQAQSDGADRPYELAAQALNAAGHRNAFGSQWTEDAVRKAYARPTLAGQVPAQKPQQEAQDAVSQQAPASAGLAPAQRLRGHIAALQLLLDSMAEIAAEIEATPGVDPEVVEKAGKYDQLRQMLT